MDSSVRSNRVLRLALDLLAITALTRRQALKSQLCKTMTNALTSSQFSYN